MNNYLLQSLETGLIKIFIKEIRDRHKNLYPEKSIHSLKRYIIDSGIIETYRVLIDKILPILYTGLSKQAAYKNIDDEIISFANDFINEHYPVYLRWRNNTIDKFLHHLNLVLELLQNDSEEISLMFEIDCPSNPSKITFGMGDKHRGGKSVAMIEYNNGKKILFKPRNLSIDKHFQELLSTIDAEIGIGIIVPKLIVRDSYGWVEFIEHKECLLQSDIELYYERIGCFTAILYSLEATDFHYENIIACGAYPVLIDLESFFHPYKPIVGTETNQGLFQSVLRTGLLPAEISIDDVNKIDISGVSDTEGLESILPETIYRYNNDDVDVLKIKGKLIGGQNIPKLNGVKVNVSNKFAGFITKGFKCVYSYILSNKTWYKKELGKFQNDEIRVLFRHTVAYNHLLREATNPSIMKSESALKTHLDWLKIVIKDYAVAKKFVKSEINDLSNYDIPLFTTKVNSTNLWYDDNKYIGSFFNSTGLETVIRRIDKMSEKDLEIQAWIINASIAIKNNLSKGELLDIKSSNTNKYSYQNSSLENNLILSTQKIKDDILSQINITDTFANWLIIQSANLNGDRYIISESSYDLFHGMPGEILFLTYYGKIFDDNICLDVAEKAYNYLIKQIDLIKDSTKTIGLYAGWGSVIYLNTQLYSVHKNKYYLEQNETLLKTLDFNQMIHIDQNYSLVKGSAGFICACLNYFEISNCKYALQLAEKASEYLITNKYPTKVGIGWRIASNVPLAGMAHGASGFILAYNKLYQHTQNKEYLEVIFQLLSYENSLYNDENKNWKDMRNSVSVDEYSTAWSHGAGGIGLSRIELIKNGISSDQILYDLNISIDTVLKYGLKQNFNLSFGSLGNIELLINYLENNNNTELKRKLDQVLEFCSIKILNDDYNIGMNNIKTLGLMTGITGIGYQCLRILYPQKVPSVLLI